MWWIIGTLIGMASNIREEKKHPELKAKWEEEVRQGKLMWKLIFLMIVVAAFYFAIAVAIGSGASHSRPAVAPVAASSSSPPVPSNGAK